MSWRARLSTAAIASSVSPSYIEAALELRRATTEQVIGCGGRMVVQVVGKEEELLVEAGLRHERVGVEDEPVLRVDVDDAQAQPLVEDDARNEDRGGPARHQILEARGLAGRAHPRQGSRPTLFIVEPFVREPRRHQLAAKRNRVGHEFIDGLIRAAQPPHVLAVHSRNQADAAVGRSLVSEPEFAVGDLDEDALQQLGHQADRSRRWRASAAPADGACAGARAPAPAKGSFH